VEKSAVEIPGHRTLILAGTLRFRRTSHIVTES
jgi:hypothetical protein